MDVAPDTAPPVGADAVVDTTPDTTPDVAEVADAVDVAEQDALEQDAAQDVAGGPLDTTSDEDVELPDAEDDASDSQTLDVEPPPPEVIVPPACPADCDDGDPCTTDSCQEPVGCVYTASFADCDDDNACTGDDSCADFVCSGKQQVCNDGSSCTGDSCDPAVGCVFVYNTAPCDDGNPCTITDSCALGLCGGVDKTCSDGNPCTTEFCDVVDGCLTFPLNLVACDDGNVCTDQDACAAGVCLGQPLAGCIPTCGDGNCVFDAGEACHTCPEDCGACAGDCCVDDGELGCEDAAVTACVCELDPICCSQLWDVDCAISAHASCEAGCDLCGNAFCDIAFGETCASCPGDCGECVICGDGQCATAESCATCPDDCGACDGSCCETNDTLGCDEPGLVLCACSVLPQCCEGPWTQECLDVALGPCGAYCPECGDLLCDPQPGVDETCESCPVDCGVCPP